MADTKKTKTIRVKEHTYNKLKEFARVRNMKLTECLSEALDIAELNNFERYNYVKNLEKDFHKIVASNLSDLITEAIQKDVNRVIGFIKTQDKNLVQVEQNLLHKMDNLGGGIDVEFLRNFTVKIQNAHRDLLSEQLDKNSDKYLNFEKNNKVRFQHCFNEVMKTYQDV